jgi:hypothetical protein
MAGDGTKNLIIILCILFSLVIGLATAYSYQTSEVISSPISMISGPSGNITGPQGGSMTGPTSGPDPLPVPSAPVGPCCIMVNTDETWNLASETCNESESGCFSCGGTWMDENTDENYQEICGVVQPATQNPCCVNIDGDGQWNLLEGNCSTSSNTCEGNCGGTWVDPTTDKNWAEICQAGDDNPSSCCLDLKDNGEYEFLQLPYNQTATTCFDGGGLWIDETTDENYREICVGSVSPTPFVPSPTCPCLCDSGTGEVIYSPTPSPEPEPDNVGPTGPQPDGPALCDPLTGEGDPGCDSTAYCTGGSATEGRAYNIGGGATCSASVDSCVNNDSLIEDKKGVDCSQAIAFSDGGCEFKTDIGPTLKEFCPVECNICPTNEGFLAGDVPNSTKFPTIPSRAKLNKLDNTVVGSILNFAEKTNIGEKLQEKLDDIDNSNIQARKITI